MHQYSLAVKLKSKTVIREKAQKHFCTKKLLIKCWWNWHLRSISSTCLCTAFTCALNLYFTNNTMPNFTSTFNWKVCQSFILYTLCCAPSKTSVNLLAQKLLLERWWNWPLRLNFINVLYTAFACADPESVKRYWWLNCIFYAFGIYESKSCP